MNAAKKSVDARLQELATLAEEGNDVEDSGILTHLLASQQLSMKEVYSNACELLLAGVDTVGLGLGKNREKYLRCIFGSIYVMKGGGGGGVKAVYWCY